VKIDETHAFVGASRELLIQGDAEGAERLLTPLLARLRTNGPALHLMGLIKKAQNQLEEAERYLRSAVAHGLSEGQYYNDLGSVLQARGAHAEAVRIFRAAIALSAKAGGARLNLVRCLLAAGEIADAEREARDAVGAEPSAETWTMLAHVHRLQERHDEALRDAQAALQFGPKLRGLRYNVAVSLERVGRNHEALTLYEKLARQDLDTPDLALNLTRGLFADGRKREAEMIAEKGVELWPGSAPLHTALARIRWARGEGEKCTAAIEEALQGRPSDINLRLTCADVLHRGRHFDKARRVLEEALMLAPDAPALLSAYGMVLDEMDEPEEGLKALRKVAALAPGSRAAQRNLLSTLLRCKRADEAYAIAHALREREPDEQYLIACEHTALRLLGKPEYKVACDYDALVRTYEITPPRGFFTMENFNAALADVLRAQHRATANPLDQIIHNGTQTSRKLLQLDDPSIKAFLSAVEGAVRDYISRLRPDPNHPLMSRARDRFRFSSMWSVRLTQDGAQPNHLHDKGWISSAYYVALMPPEAARDPKQGWLKLGEPNRPPPGCGPEKFVEPKLGTLVLFPSYMWHGTVTFEGSERLSAAFDIIPG
jgi:tetratricopeptide (TPR) repeat protein